MLPEKSSLCPPKIVPDARNESGFLSRRCCTLSWLRMENRVQFSNAPRSIFLWLQAYQWTPGAYTAGKMTWEFASGTGQQFRDFGADSVQVQSLINSSGVVKARDYYSKHGCDSLGKPITKIGGHTFGLKGLWQSGLDPTLQFVGSYDWTIT